MILIFIFFILICILLFLSITKDNSCCKSIRENYLADYGNYKACFCNTGENVFSK